MGEEPLPVKETDMDKYCERCRKIQPGFLRTLTDSEIEKYGDHCETCHDFDVQINKEPRLNVHVRIGDTRSPTLITEPLPMSVLLRFVQVLCAYGDNFRVSEDREVTFPINVSYDYFLDVGNIEISDIDVGSLDEFN
jgi:hypothetical protein